MQRKNLFLIFDVSTDLSFSELKDAFKRGMNNNYWKGYFDKTEIHLFYTSNLLTMPGTVKVPLTEFTVTMNDQSAQKASISFKVITPALVVSFASVALVWTLYIFGATGRGSTGLIVPISATAFFYGGLFARFIIELNSFKQKLKDISRDKLDE